MFTPACLERNPPDALAAFMQHPGQAGGWRPDKDESAVVGGSPSPRRRSHRARVQRTFPVVQYPSPVQEESGEGSPPDVRAPHNPTISVSDDQLRRAFGPSPIFGGSNTLYDQADTLLLPVRQSSDESAEAAAELEAMKHLSIEELISVFKGSAVSAVLHASPVASPLPSPPFDDSPWRRNPIGTKMDCWPPLPTAPPPTRATPRG